MADITQQKSELRAWAKARRAATLIPEAWQNVTELHELVAHSPAVRDAVFGARAIVGGYAAMDGECDPGPLLAALALSRVTLALPVMRGRSAPLDFRLWRPGDPMRRAVWGIEEPLDSAELVFPSVLLVPLLAIDRSGNRLGYGAGFYDRTIRSLRARGPLLTVGVTLPELILDAVPHSDYDERLDWILTPTALIQCQVRL